MPFISLMLALQQPQGGPDHLARVLILAGVDLGANERVQFSREGDVAGLVRGHAAGSHVAQSVSKLA